MSRIFLRITVWAISAIFAFAAGTINVLQPKEGDAVRAGTQLKIKWTVTGIAGVVDIHLRDMDRKFQVTLKSGIPATGSPYMHPLPRNFKTGRYLVKVVQGNVVGKSGVFRVLSASEADIIPRNPGNPVYTFANPPMNPSLKDPPGMITFLGPRVTSFSSTTSALLFPAYTSFEYETSGADSVQLFQRNFAQPIWKSTQAKGTIAVPVVLEEWITDRVYRDGQFVESYKLVALRGNRSDSREIKVTIKPRYPEVILRQREVKPMEGVWGSDAVLYVRFANALNAEIFPAGADPSDPYANQKKVILGNNGAEITDAIKIKIHGGNGWTIRLKRMDKVSWKEFPISSGYAALPEVKGFSASSTRISNPQSVDFAVHFVGAESADLIEDTSNRVLFTFPGQRGAEVRATHPVVVSKTGFYHLEVKRFQHLVKSRAIQVVMENRPLGGYTFSVKREGGIFPGPDVSLEYEVYGQEFLKFYYQSPGESEPLTKIKEFINLNGQNTKGSFKHRPSGFPARYKVMIRDTNGLMKIFYYTAN